jgi:hypothetical protein
MGLYLRDLEVGAESETSEIICDHEAVSCTDAVGPRGLLQPAYCRDITRSSSNASRPQQKSRRVTQEVTMYCELNNATSVHRVRDEEKTKIGTTPLDLRGNRIRRGFLDDCFDVVLNSSPMFSDQVSMYILRVPKCRTRMPSKYAKAGA